MKKTVEIGPVDIVSIIRAMALLACILIPSLSSAAIYKCIARDGSVTYTDVPCPEDTTALSIDPAAPPWLNDATLAVDTTPMVPDLESQSQPEILAVLCANDEFRVWLKAQRQSLPDRDVRTAKFVQLSNLCRKALHLAAMVAPVAQMSVKPVIGQEAP